MPAAKASSAITLKKTTIPLRLEASKALSKRRSSTPRPAAASSSAASSCELVSTSSEPPSSVSSRNPKPGISVPRTTSARGISHSTSPMVSPRMVSRSPSLFTRAPSACCVPGAARAASPVAAAAAQLSMR